jgi:hypothetical protein
MSRAAWDLQCLASAHSASCGHPGWNGVQFRGSAAYNLTWPQLAWEAVGTQLVTRPEPCGWRPAAWRWWPRPCP